MVVVVVVEDECIPAVLQCVGHMSLQQADAVRGQFAFLSHVVELSGEHESCQSAKKVRMKKRQDGKQLLKSDLLAIAVDPLYNHLSDMDFTEGIRKVNDGIRCSLTNCC